MPDENELSGMVTYEAAQEYIKKRSLLPTGLSSRQIGESFPEKVRVNAFFSAKIAERHLLERLREVSDRYSAGEIDLASARLELRRFLVKGQGVDPHGGISNIASMSRINLILEQNRKQAAAVADYALGRDEDIEKIFPSWRYVESSSVMKRDEHLQYAGKVFLKSDPIWKKIFPPNGFGCNCSVENCDETPSKPLKNTSTDESGYSFDPAQAFEKAPASKALDGSALFRSAEQYFQKHPESNWIFVSNGEAMAESAAAAFDEEITEERKKHIFSHLSEAEKKAEARAVVDAATLAAAEKYFSNLKKEEQQIILDWTAKDKNGLNNFFRPPHLGKAIPPEQRKKIDQLNKLVDDAPKYVGAAYRGMNFRTKKDADDFFNNLFEHPRKLDGFTSCSPSMETAYYYANLPRGGRFKLIMIIPDSKNGTYLGANSLQPRDKELLFNQKTYFHGLTSERVGDTVYVIAEEVYDENR